MENTMEFTVEQDKFREALAKALPALATQSALGLPAFSSVRLEVGKAGLSINCTNGAIYTQVTMPAIVTTPGVVLTPGKTLNSFMAELRSNTPVMFKVLSTGGKLEVASGSAKVNLNVIPSGDYPEIPAYGAVAYSLAENFFRYVDKVKFSASKDDTRATLMGVLIDNGVMVATDGYRLAMATTPFRLPAQANLPAESLKELRRSFSDGEMGVHIDTASGRVFMLQGDVAAMAVSLGGNFPHYEQLIPKTAGTTARVKKTDIMYSLNLMGALDAGSKSHGGQTVQLAFKPGRLTITTSTPEAGSGENTVACAFDGETQVLLSSKFLKEVVHVLGEEVNFELRANLSPVVMRDEGYVHVIMPKKN